MKTGNDFSPGRTQKTPFLKASSDSERSLEDLCFFSRAQGSSDGRESTFSLTFSGFQVCSFKCEFLMSWVLWLVLLNTHRYTRDIDPRCCPCLYHAWCVL